MDFYKRENWPAERKTDFKNAGPGPGTPQSPAAQGMSGQRRVESPSGNPVCPQKKKKKALHLVKRQGFKLVTRTSNIYFIAENVSKMAKIIGKRNVA